MLLLGGWNASAFSGELEYFAVLGLFHTQKNKLRRVIIVGLLLQYYLLTEWLALILFQTMETGVLAEWYVSEGSTFSAGEPLAKVETDKGAIYTFRLRVLVSQLPMQYTNRN